MLDKIGIQTMHGWRSIFTLRHLFHIFREPLGADGKRGRMCWKGAAQRDPAKPTGLVTFDASPLIRYNAHQFKAGWTQGSSRFFM